MWFAIRDGSNKEEMCVCVHMKLFKKYWVNNKEGIHLIQGQLKKTFNSGF